jgi:hypothetical protein
MSRKFSKPVNPLSINTIERPSAFVSSCTTVDISSASPIVPYMTAAISAHRALARRNAINVIGMANRKPFHPTPLMCASVAPDLWRVATSEMRTSVTRTMTTPK